LERLQGAALGDINATIRDRYFGAASATPALVFPRLLRLSVHHASKADNGGWFEKLKTEVIGLMPSSGIPARLSLEEQGLFAIGYYHQRQRFFEKKEAAPGEDKS
jgi:CRISPR-associated protein Csd1